MTRMPKETILADTDETSAGITDQGPRTSVGVLFVHGIGTQKRGETLLGYSEPIFRWIDRWLSERPSAPDARTTAELRDVNLSGGRGAPANLTVQLSTSTEEDDPRALEILMAESWWTETFPPPRYGAVAAWGLVAAPVAIFAYFASRARGIEHSMQLAFEAQVQPGSSLDPVTRFFSRVPQLEIQFTLYVLAIVASFVAQVLLLSVLALGIVPRFRAWVSRLQVLFANGLGDSYVLLSSPVRFAAMVRRVQEDLAWLRDRTRAVVVVAHSQGAAIAHRVLADEPPGSVAHLFTLGSGLKKLHTLEQPTRHRPVGILAAAALRILALVAFLYPAIAAGTPSLIDVDPRIFDAVGVILLVITLPLGRVKLAELHPADLAFPGLGESRGTGWTDIIAGSDPVPEGPLPETNGLLTVETQNSGSIFRDHVTYMSNAEDVVSRIVFETLDMIGGRTFIPDVSPDVVGLDRARKDRIARVLALATGRIISLLALPIVLAALGRDVIVEVGRTLLAPVTWILDLFFDSASEVLKGWAPGSYVFGVLGVLGGLMLAYLIVPVATWKVWDAGALKRFFERKAGVPMRRVIAFKLALTAFVLAVGLSPLIAAAVRNQPIWDEWKVVAAIWTGLLVVLAWLIPVSSGLWIDRIEPPEARCGETVQIRGYGLSGVDRVLFRAAETTPTKKSWFKGLSVVVPSEAVTGVVTIVGRGSRPASATSPVDFQVIGDDAAGGGC